MTLKQVCFALLIVASAVACVSAWQRDTHWERVGFAPDDAVMRLTVALRQRNVKQLEEEVRLVSDPFVAGSKYGQYWSLDRIAELVAPTDADRECVAEHFRAMGAVRVEPTRSLDFLVVDIGVRELENGVGQNIHEYRHRASNRMLYRAEQHVKWPERIQSKIDLVTGLSDYADYPHERKAMKKLLARQARACTSSAPDFEGRILGDEKTLGIQFTLYCSNGQFSTSLSAPCSDFPPAISSVTVSVQPEGDYPLQNVTVPVSQLMCRMRLGAVFCVFPSLQTPDYVRVTITAQSNYADGTQSAVATYPTLYAPSSTSPPAAIFERYGVPAGLRGTNPKNRQSVSAFEEQYIDVDGDLMQFFDAMNLPRQYPMIWGINNQSMPGGESTLDIQYIMGVGAGVPTIFWSVSGPGPAVPPGQGAYILEWALQVANTSDDQIPLVTSHSYGDTESGYLWKFGDYSYIYRCDVEFAKMALRGMTVIAGSGDAGNSNVGEAGNDISPTDPTCTPFRAFYPSNSKYVTSASSTFAAPNASPACVNGESEEACDDVGEIAVGVSQGLFWTTGGGFSNMSDFNPVAEWQAEEVQNYLNSASLPPSQYWNSAGRAYPDMSTVGHNELCVVGGALTPVDGTSASGPVLAGLISLINDARLNAGLPPMGWLNPFLYDAFRANPQSFFDIVVGTNKDGDIQARCSPFPTFCDSGFVAAPGWDPVSGLGTPNFPVLLNLALQYTKK